MSDNDDETLGRLLTEHLPPIPARFAEPPALGLRAASRDRSRRRRATLVFASALAVVLVAGGGAVVWNQANAGRELINTDIPSGGTADAGGTGASGVPGPKYGLSPIQHVDLAPDGRTLVVTYLTGAPECNAARLDHTETAASVVLTLVTWNPNPDAACAAYAIYATIKATLAAPLGARPVLDGADHDRELPVRNQAERRNPHFLPPGCRIAPITHAGAWETSCDGGGHMVHFIQARPGEPATQLGDTRTVLGHRTVHRQQATLELWTTAPKIDPSTGKPYTDPSTGRPYQPERTICLVWTEAGYRFTVATRPGAGTPYDQNALIQVAQRVADSVR